MPCDKFLKFSVVFPADAWLHNNRESFIATIGYGQLRSEDRRNVNTHGIIKSLQMDTNDLLTGEYGDLYTGRPDDLRLSNVGIVSRDSQ